MNIFNYKMNMYDIVIILYDYLCDDIQYDLMKFLLFIKKQKMNTIFMKYNITNNQSLISNNILDLINNMNNDDDINNDSFDSIIDDITYNNKLTLVISFISTSIINNFYNKLLTTDENTHVLLYYPYTMSYPMLNKFIHIGSLNTKNIIDSINEKYYVNYSDYDESVMISDITIKYNPKKLSNTKYNNLIPLITKNIIDDIMKKTIDKLNIDLYNIGHLMICLINKMMFYKLKKNKHINKIHTNIFNNISNEFIDSILNINDLDKEQTFVIFKCNTTLNTITGQSINNRIIGLSNKLSIFNFGNTLVSLYPFFIHINHNDTNEDNIMNIAKYKHNSDNLYNILPIYKTRKLWNEIEGHKLNSFLGYTFGKSPANYFNIHKLGYLKLLIKAFELNDMKTFVKIHRTCAEIINFNVDINEIIDNKEKRITFEEDKLLTYISSCVFTNYDLDRKTKVELTELVIQELIRKLISRTLEKFSSRDIKDLTLKNICQYFSKQSIRYELNNIFNIVSFSVLADDFKKEYLKQGSYDNYKLNYENLDLTELCNNLQKTSNHLNSNFIQNINFLNIIYSYYGFENGTSYVIRNFINGIIFKKNKVYMKYYNKEIDTNLTPVDEFNKRMDYVNENLIKKIIL